MIKINLLPLDKRKTERTPLKGAGLMIADAVVFAAVAILVVISLIQIGNVQAEIDAKKKTLASLQDDVRRHDELKRQSETLQMEYNDLEKVTATRPFKWSEVVDGLWEAVDKHKRVWIDSCEVADAKVIDGKIKQVDPKTPLPPAKYGIVLRCHVAGFDVKSMTAFRQELKENEKLTRYFPMINFDVQWTKMEQKEFAEKASLDFDVILINTGQTEANTVPVPVRRTTP